MKLGCYELDNIYNEDCYESIKKIPDNSVDLIITDVPYLYTQSGGTGFLKTRKYCNEYNGLSTQSVNSKKGSCGGFDMSLYKEFVRVMKKINIYIYISREQLSKTMAFFEELGCSVNVLVWHKTNPIPTCNNTYLKDLEYCVFAHEKGIGLGGTYETKSLLYTSTVNKTDKELYEHATIKPLPMIKNFVINSSEENDIVLDTFMGSGTTAVACKELNRRYIGFEIDKHFCDIANDRLQGISVKDRKLKETGITDIFDFM